LAGIYIHIPFCKKACHYCDFHFSTTLNLVDNVVDAIVLEAERMKSYINEPIETIYFGGGTPSILNGNQLEKITEALYSNFEVLGTIEFTLEANPDDLTEDKIISLKNIGVNRLSIGTQSFDDKVLIFLNRSHTAKQTLQAIELSKKHGISNISVDLIYGIPGQSKSQWKANLEELGAMEVSHISSYALTIENKTVFGNWLKKGKLKTVEDDSVADEYELMVDFFTSKNYEHYEVSNFAKQGYRSRHNSSYWHQKPYLGLGPGAHSFNGHSRQFNIASNPKYCKQLNAKLSPFKLETLRVKERVTEHIFTRIRTIWGVDFNELYTLFSYQLSSLQLIYIQTLVSEKMATFVNHKLVLNSKGFFISDSVALELISE